jgi:Tol biopolymer transport system component/O-antigen ligase
VSVVVVGLLVALVALALAQLGLTALYAVLGVVFAGVVVRLLRDDLRGPVTDRLRRLWSGRASTQRPPRTRRDAKAPSTAQGLAVASLAALGSAVVAWAVATQGGKAIGAVVALLVLGLAALVLWPLVVELVRGRPSEVGHSTPHDAERSVPDVKTPSRRGHATPKARGAGLVALLLVAAAGAGVAWILAALGTKGLAAAAGGVLVVALLVLVRDKTVFVTFVAVASLTFVLHKSFGPQDLEQSGGAISVYITTFDVLVLLLFGLWAREGTLVADVRAAFRQPIIWFPLVGILLLLPSLLSAPSMGHAAAELVRMGWMYLLYVYVAVRVRTVRHIWAVLGGLVVFVAVELVVVMLQWRTGGVLGLSFLGVPQTLGERTTDAQAIGRPFGTIIHPVFMAAALGAVAMVALAFAIHRRRSLIRVTAGAAYLACLACMWVSQTRASFVAVLAVSAVLVIHGIRVGAIPWSAVRAGALIAVAGVVIAFPVISKKLSDNFGTGHFWTEVDSRLQMNDIAGRMIADRPLLGVGLNNYELVLPRYEQGPVIFFGHPVHNLYLLTLAEAGLIGLIGLVLVGVANYDIAIRLGRSADPLLRPLGIGVAAAMAFLMVEELLGFSLRQDIPLALYWLLAGLAVAGTRLSGADWPALGSARTRPGGHPAYGKQRAKGSGMPPRPSQPTAGPSRPRRGASVVSRALLALPLAGLVLAGLAPAESTGTASAATTAAPAMGTVASTPASTPAGLVFSARDRTTGVQGIFTANLDGTGIRRITPADGKAYNWPRWAFGNTKIVFTVRTGPPGSPESIALMNPDGSGARVLQSFEYRVGQPIVEPNGRYVLFTAQAPWFPQVATFRLDLVTGESRNVSAVTVPVGGFDSDPYLSSGSVITFIWTEGKSKASVTQMRTDGTDRRRITNDRWFNTDPGVSADGRQVVIASYRGSGNPSSGGKVDFTDVKPGNWKVVVRPTAGGPERVYTEGQNCTTRTPLDPCTPQEMSGFVPRFSPDGRSVTFVGAQDVAHTCICRVALDGSSAAAILSSSELAIDWYDWPQRGGLSTDTSRISTKVRDSRLLVVTARPDGSRYLVGASADLMHQLEIPLPAGLEPLEARWGPDRSTIVFTAEVPVGKARAPHPAPPLGQTRRVHVTFDDIDPVATTQRLARLSALPGDEARQQVFLRRPDGTVRQLTDAWTEDWRDGLAPGDVRGSSQPVMTPDGAAVIVRNTSTLTGESFLLRIDLRTGAVLNLTNGTAGAVPTDDADPALSADGRRIAFTWTEGSLRSVHAMDAGSGERVTDLVGGETPAGMPHWSPDGRSLVWVSGGDGSGGAVVRAPLGDKGTGRVTVLSRGIDRGWSPLVAPEGDRVLFLARTGNTLGVYAAEPGPTGSWSSPQRPRVLQPDPLRNVFGLDWR